MASDAETASPADDPVAYFLQELTYHGKTERTREAYERVLRQFETFVRGEGASLATASRRECMAWVHTLREGRSRSTVASYASYLHRFYAYMTQVGAFEGNPMTLVLEEMDESIDTDPARREILVPEMREFVAHITHPLDRAVVVTLLKTGMRVGELCNLDMRDLNLEGEARAAFTTPPRGPLAGRPNSLYISESPARGEVTNGERRTESNKRKRPTVIPVDEELRQVIERWLAVRPGPRSDAEPLFCSTREWGRRLTGGMVGSRVSEYAADHGWYQSGGGAGENVTPHYFRHFFTTHLRDRTGDRGIVKYLRGDVASDIVDTYTHDWGDRVRKTYEQHIYSLL
ncbi:tyrosine-type recombinase/integrase [Halosegnis sp.]|uniref:tyrosine-type recombinase/integrase n=1 Tax=Halosegnis sp. TaxID=2864959 RepID=UPI0035D4523E